MKLLSAVAVLACAGLLASCKRPADTAEVVLSPAKVGDKTDLYEVEATNRLKLAPGVTMQPTVGPCGEGSAMLLMRANGEIGGYVICGCVGATTSTCKTVNDNPNHPECSGACTTSEGVGQACQVSEPLPGPPKDPLAIRLRSTR